MLILIYGGSGSGKSEFGEQILEKLKRNNKYYLATMKIFDVEGEKKVERHRKLRATKGFITIEAPIGIEKIGTDTKDNAVILECMSNLLANEMYDSLGRQENPVETILKGIETLKEKFDDIIIISNNVFDDGQKYQEETKQYMRWLGKINQKIASASDITVEVIHGIPWILKGEEKFEKINK